MTTSLIVIIILLIVYCGFKDIIHAKHLERLELRLKGLEPIDFDRTQKDEASNSIYEENLVDLSMVDTSKLAEALAKNKH